MLSPMNADLIGREAHLLLEEVAGYEEPRVSLPESVSLAELARSAGPIARVQAPVSVSDTKGHDKGHVTVGVSKTAEPRKTDRREAILSVLRTKGPSYIKDLSTVIRDVSEKTIQRELQTLVGEGTVTRSGERRWTTYALSS